ncbi:hypothetical protein ROA7450_01504 [Roseovarius albus]|uniref:Uncharacterized protein n=2 Tax=Roseovarius albus TaxID=1247867 RepID=A0A1X6YVT3_9RHOB|nr:hypothetical protein ROA7450_01504 [Roseovarius albus]
MVFMRWGNGACAYNFKYTLLKRRSVNTHTLNSKTDLSRSDGMSRATRDALVNDAQRIEKSVRKFMARENQPLKRDCLPELEPANLILDAQPPRRVRNRAGGRSIFKKVLPAFGRSDPRETEAVDAFKTYGWIILLAVVMFLLPLLIPTILLVTFWVALIGYLSVGPQRFSKFVRSRWQALPRLRSVTTRIPEHHEKKSAIQSNGLVVQRDSVPCSSRDASENSSRTYRNHAKVPPFDQIKSSGRS